MHEARREDMSNVTSLARTDEPSVGAWKHIYRGAMVDWTPAGSPARRNGRVIVVDLEHAWVQFPACAEPYKYPVLELRPAELPDFRAFCERHGGFEAQTGEPQAAYIARIMGALADYAEEIKRRA